MSSVTKLPRNWSSWCVRVVVLLVVPPVIRSITFSSPGSRVEALCSLLGYSVLPWLRVDGGVAHPARPSRRAWCLADRSRVHRRWGTVNRWPWTHVPRWRRLRVLIDSWSEPSTFVRRNILTCLLFLCSTLGPKDSSWLNTASCPGWKLLS